MTYKITAAQRDELKCVLDDADDLLYQEYGGSHGKDLTDRDMFIRLKQAIKILQSLPGAGEAQVDPAYEYLPGDAPTKLSEALEILSRVQEHLRAQGHDSYEAVFKVRALFKKRLESLSENSSKRDDGVHGCDKLLTALEEIREVYAGSEGFIPETAPEAYIQKLFREKYDIAVKALSEHSAGREADAEKIRSDISNLMPFSLRERIGVGMGDLMTLLFTVMQMNGLKISREVKS